MLENRLQLIYDAASSLFINKGYARTQIKDIANEIGLSAGMIYVYFKGKKEILAFILKCAIDRDFIRRDFAYPIDGRWFEGLQGQISQVLEENSKKFGMPLSGGARGYSFENMLSDAFDTISRYGTGCLILEKNINDIGELGEQYQNFRKEFFRQVLEYLNLYLARGELRPMRHPELTARLIIETLAWWGMHVMNDTFDVQKDIPKETAKEVCMDNLLNAYQIK